jgi:hypothetical protein
MASRLPPNAPLPSATTTGPSSLTAPAPRTASQQTTEAQSQPAAKDFSLIAEAAKRAQLAVMMREMGDVKLS